MALHFCKVIPYAIPGALALLGCWWIYSQRKKLASCSDQQEIADEEEQQEEVPEKDSTPATEACAPAREAVVEEEECPEKETSTSLPSAVSTTPSLLCQTPERLDLSQDLPELSVTPPPTSTLEADSEKPETPGSQDESSGPACVSPAPISECHGSAAVSLPQDSGSSADQHQCAGGYAFALRLPTAVGPSVCWVIFRVSCKGVNRLVPFQHKVNSCLKLGVGLSSPVKWAVPGCRPGC